MSTSLILPNDDYAQNDAREIYDRLGSSVDLVVNGGACGFETTTVVDLTDDLPLVVREGLGEFDARV